MSRPAELHIMTKAAEKAAFNLVRDFGELERLQVSKKGFGNFVTTADKKSEERIVYELSKSRPEFSLLCEESGFIERENKTTYWVIDPIDGTTNFMRGIPYFAINIALVEENDPVAALTLDPMRGDHFKADVGGGAFLGNRNRIRVSRKDSISESVVATHIWHENDSKLFESGAILRRTGSIALDLAYLASGKYDVVIAENVQLWDIAAGILLVKEAGGFLEYTKNSNGKYDIRAAASSKLLKAVSEILK